MNTATISLQELTDRLNECYKAKWAAEREILFCLGNGSEWGVNYWTERKQSLAESLKELRAELHKRYS